jgi:hypothetical protein
LARQPAAVEGLSRIEPVDEQAADRRGRAEDHDDRRQARGRIEGEWASRPAPDAVVG